MLLKVLATVLVLGVFALVLAVASAAKDMAVLKNENGHCSDADYDLSDKLAAHKN